MDWPAPNTVGLAVVVGCVAWFIVLVRHRIIAAESRARPTLAGIRALGLDVLLLPWVIALGGLVGSARELAPLVLPGVALLLWTFAPRYVTAKVVPLALVGVGLEGFVRFSRFALMAWWDSGHGHYPPYGLAPSAGGLHNYPTLVYTQAWSFITAGLWLTWRRMDAASRAGRFVRSRRWSLVLLLVAVLLVERLSVGVGSWYLGVGSWYQHWYPLTLTVAGTGAAFLVLRFPAVAADLAIAGLILFGLHGIAIAALWTSGLHVVAYGVTYVDGRITALLAGAQGLALAGAGLWLLPRALDDRTRSLLRSAADRELAGRVTRLARTRSDAVDSAAAELRRLERDLHDGAQARLVALGISLRAAERLIHASPDAAAALVAEARESSQAALGELRDLVRGIRPPILADRGLADAVRALALDTPLRTDVDANLPGRPDLAVESACYFAIAELLANAVKHSGARHAQVRIGYAGGALRITVTDDGVGGTDPARGSGLTGLERRLATFDGVLAVSSPPGGPTIVAIEVPCALSSLKTSTC